jgi:hypothetical protein
VGGGGRGRGRRGRGCCSALVLKQEQVGRAVAGRQGAVAQAGAGRSGQTAPMGGWQHAVGARAPPVGRLHARFCEAA